MSQRLGHAGSEPGSLGEALGQALDFPLLRGNQLHLHHSTVTIPSLYAILHTPTRILPSLVRLTISQDWRQHTPPRYQTIPFAFGAGERNSLWENSVSPDKQTRNHPGAYPPGSYYPAKTI